jgi:hypothetical protein|tara:strand:+ start:257 stop:886 length:630 start_codon:yes stop_codon:yes gene_type:complete
MQIYDVICESKKLDERPVGRLKNLATKALGKVTFGDTSAGFKGSAETNDKANATYSAFRKHLGRTKTPKNQVPAEELKNWLASMKMSTVNVPASGVIDNKAVEKAILQSTIDTAKSAPSAAGAGAPSAKAATKQPGAKAQAGGGGQKQSMIGKILRQPQSAGSTNGSTAGAPTTPTPTASKGPGLDPDLIAAVKKLSKAEKASLASAIK